jgi:Secretion system C-terminal sorting domain/Divergent InlB B-repeat domain
MKVFLNSLLILFSLIYAHSATAQDIIYVDADATGKEDGSSWSDAYVVLEDAIANGSNGDSIWVKKGMYRPKGGKVHHQFKMKNGVHLFGGFVGTETKFPQRDVAKNRTILDGNVGDSTKSNDNTRYIVYAYQFTTLTALDGFTIQNGYAYVVGSSSVSVGGGAVRCRESKLIVRNCHLRDNYTYMRGGAVYMDGNSSLYLENCLIENNKTGTHVQSLGGAVFANSGYLSVTNCDFKLNSCRRGGAISTYDVSILVDRCRFYGNEAWKNYGGAIDVGSESSINCFNSLFVGNYAETNSSAVYVQVGINFNYHRYVNCTFANNYVKSSGYTVYTSDQTRLQNCIFWGNKSSKEIFYLLPTVEPSVSNCIIEGGLSFGSNVLNKNPQFVKPASYSSTPFNADTFDYSLRLISPAIDAGDDSFVHSTYNKDLLGGDRVVSMNPDLGAIESPYKRFRIELEVSDTLAAVVTSDSLYAEDSTSVISFTGKSSCFDFLYWKEADTLFTKDSSFSFQVQSSRKFVAVFEQKQYTVKISTNPFEGGSAMGDSVFKCVTNNSHSFKAEPNRCFEFVKWTIDGKEVSKNADYVRNVDSNIILVAHFAEITLQLITSANPSFGGSVTSGGTFGCDSSFAVVAAPADCYEFVNWTTGGKVVSNSSTFKGQISDDINAVANFAKIKYKLTLLKNPSPGGSTSGAGSHECGSKVIIKATPNTDYKFLAWLEDGKVVATKADTLVEVREDRTFTADFVYSVGVKDFKSVGALAIYPNPSNGIIHLGCENCTGHVEIYNVIGNFLKEVSVIDNTVDLSDFNKGLYFIRIEAREGLSWAKIRLN